VREWLRHCGSEVIEANDNMEMGLISNCAFNPLGSGMAFSKSYRNIIAMMHNLCSDLSLEYMSIEDYVKKKVMDV
jgi:hypothetical protein